MSEPNCDRKGKRGPKKGLDKIPRIRLRTGAIANKADMHKDLYVYDSDIPGVYLIREEKSVMIITRENGYLVLKVSEIETIINELQNAKEDMTL